MTYRQAFKDIYFTEPLRILEGSVLTHQQRPGTGKTFTKVCKWNIVSVVSRRSIDGYQDILYIGGPTGHEGFYINLHSLQAYVAKYHSACAGNQTYNECRIIRSEMEQIFDQWADARGVIIDVNDAGTVVLRDPAEKDPCDISDEEATFDSEGGFQPKAFSEWENLDPTFKVVAIDNFCRESHNYPDRLVVSDLTEAQANSVANELNKFMRVDDTYHYVIKPANYVLEDYSPL